MILEEKFFYTICFSFFAIAVWFTSNTGNNLKLPGGPAMWDIPGLFWDEDGTLKKYTKPFFSLVFLFLIIAVWIFG